MNKEEFHGFISGSTGNESNICQICVIKGGEVVYEDSWRGFKPEDPVNVNSVTKGVMAILAGIAVDKKAIKSIDEKVIDYFPDYQVKRGALWIIALLRNLSESRRLPLSVPLMTKDFQT